jgi:hypothetical protein
VWSLDYDEFWGWIKQRAALSTPEFWLWVLIISLQQDADGWGKSFQAFGRNRIQMVLDFFRLFPLILFSIFLVIF